MGITGLNFAMDSATAVWDPNSTGMPSSHAQFQVAFTYLPFVLAHSFTDVGLLVFTVICWCTMDADNRATLLKFYGLPDAFAQEQLGQARAYVYDDKNLAVFMMNTRAPAAAVG